MGSKSGAYSTLRKHTTSGSTGFFGRARHFQVETVGYLLESSLKKLQLARVELNLAKTQRRDAQFPAETKYSYCSKINKGFLAKSSLPPPNCFLRLRANGRYIVDQQLPTLLDVTCCVCLHTLLHVVGCCCVLLRKV